MPTLAYKQPALQRNKPMDYAKAGPADRHPPKSKSKKHRAAPSSILGEAHRGVKPAPKKKVKTMTPAKKKKQGYKDRKDESIAMRVKKKRTKKQLAASRDESYGKWGRGTGKGKINKPNKKKG
jgi:hypothetical protein